MTLPNEKIVVNTVRQIRALRKLTKETGTQTMKTQDEILRSLSPADLTAVALMLDTGRTGADHEPLAK